MEKLEEGEFLAEVYAAPPEMVAAAVARIADKVAEAAAQDSFLAGVIAKARRS